MELVDEFPPVGESEIEDSQKFIVELLGFVLVSTLIWALFRITTSGIIDDPGSISFNLSSVSYTHLTLPTIYSV